MGFAAVFTFGSPRAIALSAPVCGGCRVWVEILMQLPRGVSLLLVRAFYALGHAFPDPPSQVREAIVWSWIPVLLATRWLTLCALPIRVDGKLHRDWVLLRVLSPAAAGTLQGAPPSPDPAPPRAIPDRMSPSGAGPPLQVEPLEPWGPDEAREQGSRRRSNALAGAVIAAGVVCFALGAYLRIGLKAELAGWSFKPLCAALLMLGKVLWRAPQPLTRSRRDRKAP
jgi:hypothetical protein